MALYLTEKHIKYKNGKDDCVSPFFIYQNNNKRTKVFCSLKISNKNWCFDKKRVKLKKIKNAEDFKSRI